MTVRTATRLRDALEQDILTGRIEPGSKLDEISLAKRFGVSRTPIREALFDLCASGLIDLKPHRGAVVARFGPARLAEMFEVMAELEGMCGRLAAANMGEEGRAALGLAYAGCEAAAARGDADDYYYENERFHGAIYQGCGNIFLSEEAQKLHHRLRPYRRLQLRLDNRLTVSLAEHRAIVDAIERRDQRAAAQRLREHVAVQRDCFNDLVDGMRRMQTEAAIPEAAAE